MKHYARKNTTLKINLHRLRNILNSISKKKIILITIICLVLIICITVYRQGTINGFFKQFKSQEDIVKYIKSYGVLAPLIFGILQFVQVIISPIPGNITTLAGAVLFGFWDSFIISSLAIISGSIVAFMLARKLGKPFVAKIVGRKTISKYLSSISKRQLYTIYTMFLLPFFPDDALCLISGLSGMSLTTFIVCVLITRPATIAITSLVGSGILFIPIWGWALAGLLSIFVFITIYRIAT